MPRSQHVQTYTRPEPDFRYKQCLIIRNDVKMSCGKRCAQAAHASIGAYNNADKALQKAWLSEGQKKVVLKANDERTLYELKVIAERAGISSFPDPGRRNDRDPARDDHCAWSWACQELKISIRSPVTSPCYETEHLSP